jgi:hypothetical protein
MADITSNRVLDPEALKVALAQMPELAPRPSPADPHGLDAAYAVSQHDGGLVVHLFFDDLDEDAVRETVRRHER